MCGIAGLWAEGGDEDDLRDRAIAMTAALGHRGPDDSGIWIEPRQGLGLGHRRLSIVDLSERGRQPMVSASGRFAVSFNGEIYNFRRLRPELERAGARFTGTSDTEVLLAAIEHWGLDRALARFIGMFAFALWDRRERELSLVRDRLGVKPLYYGWSGSTVWFASELAALRADRAFDSSLDVASFAEVLQYGCVPEPWTVHACARKLPPGTVLRLRSPRDAAGAEQRIERYWSVPEPAEAGGGARMSASEAEEEFRALLSDSIELRMIADVPIGAFLSGGIDSSLVVAWMQSQTTQRVRTFTIGYDDPAYDESVDARRVADVLGTEHHELRLSTPDVLAAMGDLPAVYDEPFADPSQIPTLLVSRFARQHVKVVLTGDGGDELFIGYNRQVWGRRASRAVRLWPTALRGATGRALGLLSPDAWDRLVDRGSFMIPSALRVRTPGEKIAKLAKLMGAADDRGVYASLASHVANPWPMVPSASRRPGPLSGAHWPAGADFADVASRLDTRVFLPADILVKVDRASMSVGLEAREPLLDHRLAELAFRLPLDLKVRDGVGKWILRQVLATRVPRALFERPKMGFGLPLDRWLRSGLRDWAGDLLSPSMLAKHGVFEADSVQSLWQSHLSGRRSHHTQLWTLLMCQQWLEARRGPQVEAASRVASSPPAASSP